MDVTFSQLTYFVAVAEEQSFNRGAARLHLSQPTLSRQLSELEGRLGVQLFLRSRSGTVLTEAGQAFLRRARALLEAREAMQLDLRPATACPLKVGYIAPSLFGAVGEAISDMRRIYPDLTIQIVEAAPGKQPEMLLRDEIDIAFLGHFEGAVSEQIECTALYRIPLSLVIPVDHPLASRGFALLREIHDERYIGLREDLYPGRQASIQQLARTGGFEIAFQEESDSLISLFATVAHQRGASLVPSCASALTYPGVSFIPVAHPDAEVDFVAATRRGSRNPYVQHILELCRAHGAADSVLRVAQAKARARKLREDDPKPVTSITSEP